MSHLDPERLAALADEAPTAAEAVHLAGCGECRRERDAYRTLLALAAEERRASPAPLTSWEALAGSLRAEGLMMEQGAGVGGRGSEGGAPRRAFPAPGSRVPRWLYQAAAAVLIAAAGVTAGRWSARTPAAAPAGTIAAARDEGGDARLAQNDQAADTVVRFQSLVEAQAVLDRAEREYRQAMTYLAANDTTTRTFRNSDVYRARLAALDAMAGAAREGVIELPHDPLINQAYLSTLAAREATIRQLGGTLPAGVRLTRF
ncbi:MAG TPA: hypothetical protein VFS05_13705 [Gemmatimonadaceae bacterium]|nr:hypothetical protein [Gemmatimonadaceae bacterium]